MRVSRPDLDTALSALTPRERQIVAYVAAGRPNKVIAIDLGISLRTAEAHRARIFAKLDARNAMQLACRLCAHGRSGASPILEAAAQGDLPDSASITRAHVPPSPLPSPHVLHEPSQEYGGCPPGAGEPEPSVPASPAPDARPGEPES
ncbi:response regulator transcription factor [Achromobacter spanius]|uniref:response regulator transcription factor n=1 Tax=Achromobacter spanius TaxID=217203 RepID=UPI0036EF49A3